MANTIGGLARHTTNLEGQPIAHDANTSEHIRSMNGQTNTARKLRLAQSMSPRSRMSLSVLERQEVEAPVPAIVDTNGNE